MTKKIMLLFILFVISILLIGCIHKRNQEITDYLSQNQASLKDNFLYSGNYQTISGVSDLGKKQKVLYVPSNVNRILTNSLSNLTCEKIVMYSKNNITIDTGAITNFLNSLEITIINNVHFKPLAMAHLSNISLSFVNVTVKTDNSAIITNSKITNLNNINSNISLDGGMLVIKNDKKNHINYLNRNSLVSSPQSATIIDDFAGFGETETATFLDLSRFTSIGKYTITSGKNLKRITLSDSLLKISNLSFQNTSLTSLSKFENKVYLVTNDCLFYKHKDYLETILLTSSTNFLNIEQDIVIGSISANNNHSITVLQLNELFNNKKLIEIKTRAFTNLSLDGEIIINNPLLKIDSEIFWGTNPNSLKVNHNCSNYHEDWNKRS